MLCKSFLLQNDILLCGYTVLDYFKDALQKQFDLIFSLPFGFLFRQTRYISDNQMWEGIVRITA